MANFDWLSDLKPLYDAQESWLDGSYQKTQTCHLLAGTTTPFSISCGSGLLAEHIRRFRFSPAIIQRLGQATDAKGRSTFQESFLNHLQRLRLRVFVEAAPEGTLLLPGEPIFVAQGPKLQLLLLGSAFRLLFWESTHWATQAALTHWHDGNYEEEDTPPPPAFAFNREGWKKRALYIGANQDINEPEAPQWQDPVSVEHKSGQALLQIRRLYKGETPLGDAWMTAESDAEIGVGRHHLELADRNSDQKHAIQMTRFQNIYQPVLLKGHPVSTEPSLGYLRQRMWKQLEAFSKVDLHHYPTGWAE